MSENVWNEDVFQLYQKEVGKSYDWLHQWENSFLKSYEIKNIIDNYDYSGKMAEGKAQFYEGLRKLNDLQHAMRIYYEEYNAMLSQNVDNMENVDTSNSVYGCLGGLITAGMTEVYSNSVAFHYSQQYNFTEDFSDLASFKQSLRWKSIEALAGASYFGDFMSFTTMYINGTLDSHAEKLMENSLYELMKSIPGYDGFDKENFDLVDWDSFGIEGLEDTIKKLEKLLKGASDAVDPEELTEILAELRKFLQKIPGGEDIFQIFGSRLFKLDEFGEWAFEGIGLAEDLTENIEFFMDLLYHSLSNHSQQIEYLDTIAESLEMSGLSGAYLNDKVQEIKEAYLDNEKFFLNQILDKAYDKIEGELFDLIGSVPYVGQVYNAVTGTFEFISDTATDVAGDEIAAMEALWGMEGYNNTLVSSYNHHVEMIKTGVASAEDVARADKLFEILRLSKMKEYEHMLTIAGDNTEWSSVLSQKYEELKAMDPNIIKIDHSGVQVFPSSSSGGGGGGGGQRF